MLLAEIIRAKRDGHALDAAMIKQFADAIASGGATDAHIAALGMAVYFNGMNRDETVALTMAMRDTGDVLDWSDLDRPVSDKHSTGGVGDNVSLMLAPMAAACGLAVPMISGRGLGHTGGTLDKMEAIPGYLTQPDNALFRKVTAAVGCAIIGQTANLAPADKRFYGVRDVTATVENVSLITASILSKKLAAGLGSLVLDVKCGNGAFMDNVDDAVLLAQSLVDVANGAGTTTTAIITDMSQPLASAAGNAVEVVNAVRFLTGEARDARLLAVTVALVADMLVSAGIVDNPARGEAMARATLDDGRAAELFGKMVHGLGGPADFVERYVQYLPAAPLIVPVTSPVAGYVSAINTRAIGLAVVEMGGGRRSADDTVDPAVGLTDLLAIGTRVEAGQPIAIAHVRNEAMAGAAAQAVQAAYQITDEKPVDVPLIIRRISP